MPKQRHVNRNSQQDRSGRGKVKHVGNDKSLDGGKAQKAKHQERKIESVKSRPIVPMNELQKEYLHLLRTKPYICATGFAGTSKTYLPTRVAIEKFLLGEIDYIYVVRPAVSKSNSLGFFAGDEITKMKNWISPVLDTLYEFMGVEFVEYCLKMKRIQGIPLETIKGRSLKDCFIIVDEAEDINQEEFIKCITRAGENSTMVFAGDKLQTDIRGTNGLDIAYRLANLSRLRDYWGFVDFNRPSDIVRSPQVKETILGLRDLDLM